MSHLEITSPSGLKMWKKWENVGQTAYIFNYVGWISSRELIYNNVVKKAYIGDIAVWFLNTAIKKISQQGKSHNFLVL